MKVAKFGLGILISVLSIVAPCLAQEEEDISLETSTPIPIQEGINAILLDAEHLRRVARELHKARVEEFGADSKEAQNLADLDQSMPRVMAMIKRAEKIDSLGSLIIIVINFLFEVSWFVCAYYLTKVGYLYVVEASDEQAREKAKTIFWNLILGFTISFSAYVIINFLISTEWH